METEVAINSSFTNMLWGLAWLCTIVAFNKRCAGLCIIAWVLQKDAARLLYHACCFVQASSHCFALLQSGSYKKWQNPLAGKEVEVLDMASSFARSSPSKDSELVCAAPTNADGTIPLSAVYDLLKL